MKPAKKRDISTLRTQILMEIAQHPFTLMPLGGSILAGFWSMAFKPTVPAVLTAVGGVAIAAIAALYNLMFNGPAIRDRILTKWEQEADEEENLTKQALRDELLRTPGTKDIVTLYEKVELSHDVVMEALNAPGVSAGQRAHFLPIIEANYGNAITIFNRLAYLQKRLANLLQTAKDHRDDVFTRKVAQLREQRLKMVSHLRHLLSALESVAVEVPKMGDYEIERSASDLAELERSLEIARTAYQRLEKEIKPISGIHRIPADIRSGNGKTERE